MRYAVRASDEGGSMSTAAKELPQFVRDLIASPHELAKA
jgi:hypothetical protein